MAIILSIANNLNGLANGFKHFSQLSAQMQQEIANNYLEIPLIKRVADVDDLIAKNPQLRFKLKMLAAAKDQNLSNYVKEAKKTAQQCLCFLCAQPRDFGPKAEHLREHIQSEHSALFLASFLYPEFLGQGQDPYNITGYQGYRIHVHWKHRSQTTTEM